MNTGKMFAAALIVAAAIVYHAGSHVVPDAEEAEYQRMKGCIRYKREMRGFGHGSIFERQALNLCAGGGK